VNLKGSIVTLRLPSRARRSARGCRHGGACRPDLRRPHLDQPLAWSRATLVLTSPLMWAGRWRAAGAHGGGTTGVALRVPRATQRGRGTPPKRERRRFQVGGWSSRTASGRATMTSSTPVVRPETPSSTRPAASAPSPPSTGPHMPSPGCSPASRNAASRPSCRPSATPPRTTSAACARVSPTC
jgi:hypothetical protein